jgi:hypothetical protein
MKKNLILTLIAALVLCAAPLFAKESKQVKPALTGPVEEIRQEKETLAANINSLRNQEMRISVLEQLFNDEVARLRSMQAAFCDKYKLDIDKFRLGLYRYDEAQGKFVFMDNKPAETKIKD